MVRAGGLNLAREETSMDESQDTPLQTPRTARIAGLAWLRDHEVEVRVLQTEEAVKRFNELAGIAPVSRLFHSTC